MRAILLLAAMLLALACATGRADSAARDQVRQAIEALIAAENAGNVPIILGQYADDAVLMPDRQPLLAGISRIADHYRALVREQRLELATRIDEVETDGSLAWARGETLGYLISKSTGGRTRVHDRWLIVLRRSGGAWQIARFAWQAVPD
ncbi:MAG TPA: DUF4440 domain-containing protein [Thermoanaerobaculia bacterium]|nr:DUF4440 domain-containing protein [Thermoanaerobaculia bacterium]